MPVGAPQDASRSHALLTRQRINVLAVLLAVPMALGLSASVRRALTPSIPTIDTRLDPNTASAALLDLLPGVGPAIASRIVASRNRHGLFQSAVDLQRVQGIGARTAARLTPMLRFPADP